MQMSRTAYEPISHRLRAARALADAEACERAGFPNLAEVLREVAEELLPRDRDRNVNNRERERRS